MTIGLTAPSSYYLQLLSEFPPRPIANEAELIATQNRIHSLLDRPHLNDDDRAYLNVLATLIEAYEDENEPIPLLKGIALLKILIEEDNIDSSQLYPIFGSEADLRDIVDGKRDLSATQMQRLARLFHLPPASFLD